MCITSESDLDGQDLLGPFYLSDGTEFIPIGYEESIERIAETLGEYSVESNVAALNPTYKVTPKMLTDYIQTDWDRLEQPLSADKDVRPRSGFLLSSKSASYTAGRAAEELILSRLFCHLQLEGHEVCDVVPFWDAVDQGLVSRPKGSASDDLVLVLNNGGLAIVEAKSTFGKRSVNRFCAKAIVQLRATTRFNENVQYAILALLDYRLKKIGITVFSRSEIVNVSVNLEKALVKVYR